MSTRANVIGVGMTKFAKPGASEEYNVMADRSASARPRSKMPAIDYGDVEQAYRRLRLW